MSALALSCLYRGGRFCTSSRRCGSGAGGGAAAARVVVYPTSVVVRRPPVMIEEQRVLYWDHLLPGLAENSMVISVRTGSTIFMMISDRL